MKIFKLKTVLPGSALALALIFGGYGAFASTGATTQKEAEVYICTGPQSKKYHKTKTCRGLRNCSKTIEKKKVSEAKKLGRDKCKMCYK
jgi:hypothetical protein